MIRKQLSWLLIGTLVSSVAVATEKTPTGKKTKDVPVATSQVPKMIGIAWKPTAFDQNVDRLPPNYLGLDPVKFFEMFKSKIESLKKGEFEASEEFIQRTSDKDALLSPLNTTDAYAFRIRSIPVKYDADAQAYLIGGKYGYSCKETFSFGQFKDWVTCTVTSLSRENDEYVGSNAYGASRTVERTRGRDFGLAIAKGSAVLSAAFTKDGYRKDQYSFQDRLYVPLEKARNLKDMKIAVLFVGRITDAKIVKGNGTLIEPKIDSPTDIFIMEEAIPFELKKLVYYVIETGEVLGQSDY